ncbi:MAG: hypothetical protein Q8Q86_01900 [Candidatus Daviesbacteria bacterium]|nr:hypothetical protein [Candidatus Daviesbacteria bacterium]
MLKFREKNISKLEAITYHFKLKYNLIKPNLTESEKAKYIELEEGKKRDNEKAKRHGGDSGIWKENFSEKDYILNKLSCQIGIIELAEKIKYCNENGHKESSLNISSGQSGTKVYVNCSRCGVPYQRGLTSEEWENHNKIMNTPMTI